MFEASGPIINLFRIKPDKPLIDVGYINLDDTFKINQMVHILECKHGCIAGPHYSAYCGLEPGVYFICNEYNGLDINNIEYSIKPINSSSYVMKYLVLKTIARKIKQLSDDGKLFLPLKWFAYSQITCCDNKVLKCSEPYRLFTLKQCLILRVEHIPVDDNDALFLLADIRYKRFNTLMLTKIINILLEKGYDYKKIDELLRVHYYSCIEEGNRLDCIMDNILENDKVRVIMRGKEKVVFTDNVWLNPHPKHTRDFIETIIGEKLSNIEKIQRVLGRQRPRHRIENIKMLVEKLLIRNNVFPLELGNVKYTLELTPQKIVITEEE